MVVFHITAQSKDGFEKDISRIESKRNLFNFICNNKDNTPDALFDYEKDNYNHIGFPIFKRKKFKNLENIILNFGDDDDNNFAYEGIFDKKDPEKKVSNLADRSRMDISRFMGTFNQSRMYEEGLNMNNTLHKHANSSMSKFSEHSQFFNASGK